MAMAGAVAERPPQQLPAALEFVAPIPGFPDERAFTVSPLDDGGVLYALRSARTPGLRFVLASPGLFFPDYAPDLTPAKVAPLGASTGDDLLVMVIVTVTSSLSDATANQLAPIVIAPDRGTAMQVVLADSGLPLRAPLLAAAS